MEFLFFVAFSFAENRLIVMKMTQTVYLLFISGLCSFALGSSDFHLIPISKSYNDAKTYCREMYTDLASIQNSADMNNLVALVSPAAERAWIGLETGDVWVWHWSWPDQKVNFVNWKAGEPQITPQDACGAMDQHGEWFESECNTGRSFVCDDDASGHVFVAQTKSWRDAENHCRGLSSHLVSVRSAEENEAVHNLSVSQSIWIGLFKDPWRWSDGSNSSFRHWKPSQPNYLAGQNCTVAVFKDQGKWNDLKCSGRRNFVCRGASKSVPTTTSQTSTRDANTADQLTVLPNKSQEVTITFHFTVASNVPNVTTKGATTASRLTTPNTTALVSSTSSTEPNNATAGMTAAMQQPPTTTVHVSTDGVSALTTLAGTSAQSTTRPSTLKPTEGSQSLHPGNLILIQENMTWIEALSYCREHHIDLVHVITKDIQEKVAQKARNATSLHVWLGLRYTCNFNFWFWASSTTGCYLNWAPGQGPEGKYDCGVTGAIEATGRQQWVGLPETEKLNFICQACAR